MINAVLNSMAPVEVEGRDHGCVQNRIRSFVILDLETTSLPYDKPVKITEVAVVAALREHILGYGIEPGEISVPRVLSKLTMCVSPRRIISRSAADITRMLLCNLLHVSYLDYVYSWYLSYSTTVAPTFATCRDAAAYHA